MEEGIFQPYLKGGTLFQGDRSVLSPSYVPDRLPHREEQVDQLAGTLSTALRGGRCSNVSLFGKPGTGKTAVARFVGKELKRAGPDGHVAFVYLNCQVADTPYAVLQQIGNALSDGFERIPFTGLSIDRVYRLLVQSLDGAPRRVVVALDEVDRLVFKSGDDVLYHLSKANDDLDQASISMVCISNDLKYAEHLDARVRSRLSDEKMVFPPYNAQQLRDILEQRARLVFREGVLEPGLLDVIAGLAAQEHGDARRALDLLRVAAEVAERNGDERIGEMHVRKAKARLELDTVTEAVRSLPTQSKLVLLSIVVNDEAGMARMRTGDVYTTYKTLCRAAAAPPLTSRRVTDLISELDVLGLVEAPVRSFGRGGRTKEVSLAVSGLEVRRTIERDELLAGLKGYRIGAQQTLL